MESVFLHSNKRFRADIVGSSPSDMPGLSQSSEDEASEDEASEDDDNADLETVYEEESDSDSEFSDRISELSGNSWSYASYDSEYEREDDETVYSPIYRFDFIAYQRIGLNEFKVHSDFIDWINESEFSIIKDVSEELENFPLMDFTRRIQIGFGSPSNFFEIPKNYQEKFNFMSNSFNFYESFLYFTEYNTLTEFCKYFTSGKNISIGRLNIEFRDFEIPVQLLHEPDMNTDYPLTFYELVFHVKTLDQIVDINPFWKFMKFNFKDQPEKNIADLLTDVSPVSELVNSFDWRFRPSGHTEALVTVNASNKDLLVVGSVLYVIEEENFNLTDISNLNQEIIEELRKITQRPVEYNQCSVRIHVIKNVSYTGGLPVYQKTVIEMVLSEENLIALETLLLEYKNAQIYEIVRHPVTNKLLHVLIDGTYFHETLLNKQIEIQLMK
jgi:hypothetical protein